MPSAVPLRTDFSAIELRRFAKRSKNTNQSRRLLSLAAVLEGMNRTDAARIGGMDRQTLRDWVHRFNEVGPDGLLDNWSSGPAPRLSPDQKSELGAIVEAGPDREVDGVVRWRRIDLKRVIAERFGVDYHERHVETLLKKIGFSHISARPRHPGQDVEIIAAFKKLRAHVERAFGRCPKGNTGRNLVPGRSPHRSEKWCRPTMGQARIATPDSPSTSAMKMHTSSAPSVQRAEQPPRSPCRRRPTDRASGRLTWVARALFALANTSLHRDGCVKTEASISRKTACIISDLKLPLGGSKSIPEEPVPSAHFGSNLFERCGRSIRWGRFEPNSSWLSKRDANSMVSERLGDC